MSRNSVNVRNYADARILGKTIEKVEITTYKIRLHFTDGTHCEIWSNPDDEMFIEEFS